MIKSGIGYRNEIGFDIVLEAENIDFLEILGDQFLSAGKKERKLLEKLREDFTIIPHYVNLSIASTDKIDKGYLRKIKELNNFLECPYWSEHLSFTKIHGINLGHLTSIPFTTEALSTCLLNLNQVTDIISQPLAIENITQGFLPHYCDYSETEFLNELLKKSGCHHLLDITNLYINSMNFGFDWKSWLKEIDLNKVVQLHYVGCSSNNGFYTDNHGAATPNEIWEIMSWLTSKCDNLYGAILERDKNFKNFDDLILELDKARKLLNLISCEL